MTQDIGSNRTDHYRECCPWLALPMAARFALSWPVLLLAALGALGTTAGWRAAEALTLGGPQQLSQVAADVEILGSWPGERRSSSAEPTEPITSSSISRQLMQRYGEAPADPITTIPYRIVRPFAQLLDRELGSRHILYYIFGGAWTLLVWSFLGAAISRIAILQFGRHESMAFNEAVNHGRKFWLSHMVAATLPVGITCLIAVGLAVFGFVGRLSIGATLIGALWFIPLVAGLMMAVILVGLLFGWPLIWGAISAERSDAFDGMSRAYAYAYHRPLKYVGLVLFAALIGVAGWVLVWIVSELVIQLGLVSVQLGAGSQRVSEMLGETDATSSLVGAGGAMLRFWNGVVRTAASAFGFGYFWCAFAAIYLLMRLDVDSAEMDDLSVDGALKYGATISDAKREAEA